MMEPNCTLDSGWLALDECDLIIKGNPGSELCLPPAVLDLRKQYRYRRVGGASVGVVAAGLAAAAEYARSGALRGSESGFRRLREVGEELAKPEVAHGLTVWLPWALDYVAFGVRRGGSAPLLFGNLWGAGYVRALRSRRRCGGVPEPVAPEIALVLFGSDPTSDPAPAPLQQGCFGYAPPEEIPVATALLQHLGLLGAAALPHAGAAAKATRAAGPHQLGSFGEALPFLDTTDARRGFPPSDPPRPTFGIYLPAAPAVSSVRELQAYYGAQPGAGLERGRPPRELSPAA